MPTLEEIMEKPISEKPKEVKKKQPDYVGDGVAVWLNEDKNKKIYLSISLFGGQIKLNAFRNEPKR